MRNPLDSFGSWPGVARPLLTSELEQALERKQYGDFELTEGIRPWPGGIIPIEGYRDGRLSSEYANKVCVVVSVSREKLWNVFRDLLGSLGTDDLFVQLQGTHEGNQETYHRAGIDRCVLESILEGFDDMLIDNGCASIAVCDVSRVKKVHLDEHKLISIFGENLQWQKAILQDARIPKRPDMKFITEGQHVHRSTVELQAQFRNLCQELGAEIEGVEW